MAHEQNTHGIRSAGQDFVVQNALAGGHHQMVLAQLMERGNGRVARAIRVVHRGAIAGPVPVPHREVIRNGEGLTVAHDHAVDLAQRRPRTDPRIHAHTSESDLVRRPVLMNVCVDRHAAFVGSPAQFGRGDALFVEPLYAPGIDELTNFFRLVRQLGISFGHVYDFDAEVHRDLVEPLGGERVGHRLGGGGCQSALRHGPLPDRA